MEKKKLTDTGVGLYSGIRGGMLECRLPIGQPLCWNGQMEGIYTSVSSALIGDRPTSKAPVAILTDQSILHGVSCILGYLEDKTGYRTHRSQDTNALLLVLVFERRKIV